MQHWSFNNPRQLHHHLLGHLWLNYSNELFKNMKSKYWRIDELKYVLKLFWNISDINWFSDKYVDSFLNYFTVHSMRLLCTVCMWDKLSRSDPHLGCGVGGCSFVQKQECHLLVIIMCCNMKWGEAVLQGMDDDTQST